MTENSLILRIFEKDIIIKYLAVHTIIHYYYHIIINILYSIQILEKSSNIKFHKTHHLGAQFFHKIKGHTDKRSGQSS